MKRNIFYFRNKQKVYEPSVVSGVLPVYDENGNLLKLSSDVHLIKYIQDYSLSRETAEAYLASMNKSSTQFDNIPSDNLRDVMIPRSVNNITDAYMYSNYLKSVADKAASRVRDVSEMLSDLHK